jgi:translation initiation factor IF-3
LNNNSKKGGRELPGSKYKINENIRFQEVRVIDGLPNGIYDTRDALRETQSLGLDLILISEKANPPVCKAMEFSKFLYEEKQREKELLKNQKKVVLKEIQFSPNIGEHDYETKKKNVIKFLQDGNKVKVTVFFKGRTIMFKDKGELILTKLAVEIEDYGIPEALPKLMGKNMMFILKPKKQSK